MLAFLALSRRIPSVGNPSALAAPMDLDPARRDARLVVLRRDPARLEALKRGMARFLGSVLSLRDAGVRESRDRCSGEPTNVVEPTLSPRELAKRPSLAKMFLDLGGYLPTVQMLRDQRETEQLLQRIDSTRRMELKITNTSPDGMVVLLAPFVKWGSFQRAFSMPRGANQPEASIGGMRHRLVDHVGAEVEEWLGAVVRRLERAGVEPAAPEELARVVGVIASKVARRVTLADEPEAPDTDGLVAAALRDFAEGDDEVPDTRCVDCLGLAIDLAQVGTRDVCRARHATAVRRCVTKVIHSMAPQIGFCGMNADRADLERLYHAVQMEDPERMWAEIDAWHAAAGAFASLAFLEVLFLLTNAELSEDRHVLRLAVEAAEAAAAEEDGAAPPPLRLPPPTFCAPLADYVFDRERIRDHTSARVLLLLTAQLLYTPGAFERGVVSRHAAREAYVEALSESAPAIGHTRTATEHLRVGLPLRDFLQQVLDRASFNYPDVLRAMCSLSCFSMQEMFDVFHEQSPLYLEMESEMQDLTAGFLTVPLPRNQLNTVYRGFARDGLRYGLPLVFNERRACGVAPVQPTGVFADLLRTVIGECSVVDQALWVTTRAAQHAPPELRRLLDHLVATGQLAKTRPWVGPRRQRTRHSAWVYQVPFALVRQLDAGAAAAAAAAAARVVEVDEVAERLEVDDPR